MKKYRETRFSIFLILFFGVFGTYDGKKAFLIALLIIMFLLLVNMSKVKMIKSVTLIPYYPFIIIGLLSSLLVSQSLVSSDFFRGIGGVLNFLIFLTIGRIFTTIYDNHVFVKNIIYFGVIFSIYQIVRVIIGFATVNNLTGIRSKIDASPLFLVFILMLVIYDKYLFKVLSKRYRLIFSVIISLSIGITFSRTVYIYLIISIITFMMLTSNKSIMIHSLKISVAYLVIAILFLEIIPQDIKSNFISKITDIMSESSTTNDWNASGTVTNNWRGFEKYSARLQFSSYDVVHKLIGGGLDKGTYVGNYASLVGVYNSPYLPFLHNSFYTILVKMGVIGVIYYVSYLVINILILLSKIRSNILYVLPICLLIGIFISSLVIQGGIVMGNDSIVLVLLGFVTAKSFYKKEEC